jgi:hypothetical protein
MLQPTPRRRDLLALASALALTSRASAAPTPIQETPMTCCPIVELRQYTLHAGKRDRLITLFDQEFIAPQEAAGIQVLGQFRDLDDPNRFVWLRGFPDMPTRAQALGAFYGGPVWLAHKAAANDTMLDSDNVLLLHPLAVDSGFDMTAPTPKAGLVVAEIHYLDRTAAQAFSDFFATTMRPRMAQAAGKVLGVFVTEHSPNNFRLPVREGVDVLVTVMGFADEAAHRNYAERIAQGPDWREAAPESLLPQFARKPEVLRLSPTAGSRLRG